MSSIPPDEGPTQPLRPASPAPLAHERVVAPPVDASLLVGLERAVASLRAWLGLAGLIALVAIGIAIYAAVKADDAATHGGSRAGLATDARVDGLSNELKLLRSGAAGGNTAALSARVDRLSSRLQMLRAGTGASAGGSGSAALGTRVAALESSVKALASRPAPADATQSITQLSSRVDALSSDVAQLKQSRTTP